MTDPRRDDPLAEARRLKMTTVPGEREVRTGNAGRAGEPGPRERTAAASEGTPATTDPLAAARRLKRPRWQAGGIRRRYWLTRSRFRAARDLLVAADRMRDRWAEADGEVRAQLWRDLHTKADEFREVME